MSSADDERVLSNCFQYLFGDGDEENDLENESARDNENDVGEARDDVAPAQDDEGQVVIDVVGNDENDMTQWDGENVNPNNNNNDAEPEFMIVVNNVPTNGEFELELTLGRQVPESNVATPAPALINQDICAGPSHRLLQRNMLGSGAASEDQLFFDENVLKDIDDMDGFQIGSQDLDLNVNSQDLLRYGEIGNFSDVNEEDLLNKAVFDEIAVPNDVEEHDEHLGMGYVLALKAGINSVNNSEILFNEIPCFTNYAGDYDFDVMPSPDAKKCIYSESLNKIYVTCGTFEFKVKMKFDMIPPNEQFLLRSHINFVQPEHHHRPVSKCINCSTSHQRITEKDRLESLDFVLRAPYSDTKAVHFKSETSSKLYLFQPVEQPELGCDSISKGLVFTCMNSCRSGSDGGGINRREIALVFILLNKMHQVVGRRVFTLRICTAPHRDAKLDLGPKSKAKKRGNSGEDMNQQKRAKKPANGESIPFAIAGPSSALKVVPKQEQDNNVSSSQETCYSGDEDEVSRRKGLLLRSLFRQSRIILGWKSSEDERRRECSKQLFSCLKLAQDIIRSSQQGAKPVANGKN